MTADRLKKIFAVVLLSTAMLLGNFGTLAGEQAEHALATLKRLIAAGEIKPNAVLKVAFKPGNINSLLGSDLELQREWEQRTGTIINARIIPQQPAQAILKANPGIDLTVARTHEFADLLDQGLIDDLAPMLKRNGFALDDKPPYGYIRPKLQAYVGDRVAAIPADGDIPFIFLRRDLLDNPAERAAFRKIHGRNPGLPKTWQEYDELVSFFHRPDRGLFGAAEERSLADSWMYWLPRYISQAAPDQRLFDDAMKPLIDSPAGVVATESYIRTVRFSPPGITDEDKDFSRVLPYFMQGKAFAIVATIATAKLLNAPGSAVRGKFVTAPMPGQIVAGKLVRNIVPIFGNNLVVASHGAQRTLAFLFAMWLTDPDVSLRTVGIAGGHTDPYRWHHLKDARIQSLYTPEALNVFAKEWSVALPTGTGLPGDGEYLDALNKHLWLAARGEINAAEAMRRTAAEWEKITERHGGRDKQKQALQIFNLGFQIDEPLPRP